MRQRLRVLSASVSSCLVLGGVASAQDGGHEHTAPFVNGAVANERSPLFNWPNAFWDLGEGFPSPDAGGVISPSTPALLQLSDITILQPWGPMPAPDDDMWHVVAEIRPQNINPSLSLAESTFEIVVPKSLVEGSLHPVKRLHAVLLISNRPTSSPVRAQEKPYAPHIYPGDPSDLGRWQWGYPGWQWVREFANLDSVSAPFYVAAGHIVPRTSFQPLVSSVQRARELRRAMMLLITQLYAAPPGPEYTTCVAGGSFGGLTSMTLVHLRPDEFHSGVASAFSASLRATVEDQIMFDWMTAGLGLGFSGSGYTMRSAVDWTIFTRLEGVDFMSLSLLNRAFATGTPGLLRPFTVLAADEDPVTHGQDWMHPAGATSGHAMPYAQRRTFTQGGAMWNVDFLLAGKTCHGPDLVELAEPFFYPGETQPYRADEPVRRMIHAAYAERTRVLPPLTAAERKRPKSPALFTVDPHESVFARKASRTVPPVTPTLLVEATQQQGWSRFGRGTWPGANDAMRVVKLPGHTQASVFVGSADGLVTRYQMATVGTPQIQPIVQQAASTSLGWAVWALDVADLDGNGSYEVVAAAYRRVVVLDALTLTVLKSFDLPQWEQSQPQRLLIAEIYNANQPSKEIVFRTLHGRIVVMGLDGAGNLTIIGEATEAGVLDLVVGPPVGPRQPDPKYTNGIWILSARGHVVGLELDSSNVANPAFARVSVASGLQFGALADLEVRGSQLVLLTGAAPFEQRSIRVFDPANLQVVARFGHVDQPMVMNDDGDVWQYNVSAVNAPSAPNLALTAQGYYVTLYEDYICVWGHGSDFVVGVKNLRDTSQGPPIAQVAIGLATGDVDGDGYDDVVITTADGRVMWFTINELTSPTLRIPFTRSVQLMGTQLYEHRMNAAIANTWGFAAKPGTPPELHAIDVAGGWWIVNPVTGLPKIAPPRSSFVLDTKLYGIHGMSWGGAGASSFTVPAQGGGNDTFWSVIDPAPQVGSSRAILTSPYVPGIGGWSHQLFPAAVNWDDFWLFAKGGYAAPDGAGWRVAWWSAGFPNLVQQMHYSLQGTPAPTALWSSTGTGTGSAPPSPTVIGGSWPQSGISLRSNLRAGEVFDLQTVRIGKVVPTMSVPQTVVFGTGGRVIVLDGANGRIMGQSEDLGWGGMAMELEDLDNDGFAEVVCAPALAPLDAQLPPQQPGQGQQHAGRMRAYLHVLRWDPALSQLVRVSTVPIGDPYATHDLHGYGASGVAVADLTQDGVPEVLVTTLNGEFVVFAQAAGVRVPSASSQEAHRHRP